MKITKPVDLTFPVFKKMLTYPRPWHSSVNIIKLGRHKKEGRATAKIILGTHTGTHMDAPFHFIPNGKSIEKVPLDICVGPALLISFGNKNEIDVGDLKGKLNNIRGVKRLIVRFDWSRHWGSLAYYKDYPYFTKDACKWLVKRGVKLLGMDTPSPDRHLDSSNHKFLLQKGIFLLEYLCNLNKLKGPKIYLIALPLKIRGADGAPARVLAYNLIGLSKFPSFKDWE